MAKLTENVMAYISVSQFAKSRNLPERTVRHYCATGKIAGAFLTGKTWNIPEEATLPEKENKKKFSSNILLNILKEQKDMRLKGGIYHRTQIDLTYNSNRIEGSKLTHDQTRHIFETNTIGVSQESVNVDDIIETTNHFRCIDLIIDKEKGKLTESFIKELHLILKSGTSDGRKGWFKIGDYKKLPNEVGGNETCPPKEVSAKMKELLANYNSIEKKTFEDIIGFHHQFEIIHPFQDGNGRVGRLILFKECLANNIVPFIINEDLKLFYYRGLQEWPQIKEYLLDTCLTAQDNYKYLLNYFEIDFE
ncbi:Fic family protein [Flavobacterium hauense]